MATVERYYMQSELSLDIEDPESKDAVFCLTSYCTELAERFPTGFEPEKSIPASPDELRMPTGCLLIARRKNQPVGCGALKLHNEIAEVKRMWVSPDH